ncbi:MAG: hypothetical protein WBZ36_15175 [Candidatus Nitrosopolaris sp.]
MKNEIQDLETKTTTENDHAERKLIFQSIKKAKDLFKLQEIP